MSLAETVQRAFDLARRGPEPFPRLLEKVVVVYGSAPDINFDEVLHAVSSEHEAGAVRTVLRSTLARWDHEDAPDWAAWTPRGTTERRNRIYDLLDIDEGPRSLLSDRLPFVAYERPVVIARQQWDPWYDAERKVGHTFYWDALCRQLRTNGAWGEESIIGLGESTDAVVERLADPFDEQSYQSKGLVVGYVQSGKTANITGVVAKAADAGYRLVIVLAGTLTLLRDQTQRRLDRELMGVELLEDEYADDADLGSFLRHGGQPSALGAFDWIRLTSRGREYRHLTGGAIEALRFAAPIENRPLNHPENLYRLPARLLVVKKQAQVLARLTKDLARINTHGELGGVPALIIDDESDQASVNTMRPPTDEEQVNRTRVNDAIVDLLRVLPRGQYVGYTATPFANVFVDPYDAADIFPRDFIIGLRRPIGYLGASDFHDLDGLPDDVADEPLKSNERAFVRSVYGDDEHDDNLQKAIDSFVIAGAIKLFREGAGEMVSTRHHTMMVHTSHLNAEQAQQLETVRKLLRSGGYATGTAAGRLRTLFEQDFRPVSAARAPDLAFPSSFEDLEGSLGEVLTRMHRGGDPVLMVNSMKEADQLAFDAEPVWKIVVGGAKLSRGFTIEGLTVSYFRRKSPTADTLMQMGRWCGFRWGYADLVRLFIGRREPMGRDVVDVYEAFEAICRSEDEFRTELERYSLPEDGEAPITPRDIPPLVSTHLEWVRPTSRNKMFNARITFRNFGGRSVERRRVAQSAGDKRANEDLVCELLGEGPSGFQSLEHRGGRLSVFGGVRTTDEVRRFLEDYHFAEANTGFAQELEFLDGDWGDPEIESWAVLLPQLNSASERTWTFDEADLSVHRRGYWLQQKPLVNAYMGPPWRRVAEAITGVAAVDDPSAALSDLSVPKRAVMYVFPITHEGGGERDHHWIPTMGLTLLFPENHIRGRIGFAARVEAHPDEPVVDVDGSIEVA